MRSRNDTRRPDFFIIGAPKCGTTSVASWLSEHPRIFMCRPKEPYYYSTDIRSRRAARTHEEYLALFADAEPDHQAVGEASTTYLRSEVAVPRILEQNPEALFLVLLRNPLDMVASVHSQLLRTGRETEPDLAAAWRLQGRRRRGEAIPGTVLEPKDLQYGQMCRLGAQVECLLSHVSSEKVLFVLLDDIAADPRQAYLKILSFLGISDDNRTSFATENAWALPRFGLLSRVIACGMMAKSALGIRRSLGFGGILGRVNTRSVGSKGGLESALRQEVAEYFADDVELLGRLIHRDLSHWQNQRE